MNKFNLFFNAVKWHLLAVIVALIIFCIFFFPMLQGKAIVQDDLIQYSGTLHEAQLYNEKGEDALWSNSSFGGMPIWRGISNDWVRYLVSIFSFIPQPIQILTFCFLGFYILLQVLNVNKFLSFIGGVAYALSSFNIISIEAGHVNKIFDMAFMAPVIAGVILCWRGKYLKGAIITLVFTALQIYYQHIQIIYYLLIAIGIWGIFEFIRSYREKQLPVFLKGSAILAIIVMIAFLPSSSRMFTTSEYGKSSNRGGSDLNAKKAQGTGLDKEYANQWRNGIAEPFTFIVPYFYGGGSSEDWGKNTKTYKFLKANNAVQAARQLPHYWGEQPFTAGPIYFGAIVCFLFVLGMFIVKDNLKWWALAVSTLSILLSYGTNLEWFTDIFFYYVPLYNKFRSVTMIVAIAEIAFPFIGFLALREILSNGISKEEFLKGLKWSTIITGGLTLLLALLGTSFMDFSSLAELKNDQIPAELLNAMQDDRKNLFRIDAFKSLFFILASAGLIWAVFNKKITTTVFYISLAFLIITDLWTVDKRYVNSDNFKDIKKLKKEIFTPTAADEYILQDKDPYFRVINYTRNPFQDGITSYYHKSVGGYSAIKLQRYNELIDAHLSKNNTAVLNMLNTKYIIFQNQQTGEIMAQRNPEALGNVWFVKEFKIVNSADEELKALEKFNPKQIAFADKNFESDLKNLKLTDDTLSSIKLTSYHPQKLKYESNSNSEKLAVFSEIYYQPGWNAYIDGKVSPHFRVDYVLRAMKIPPGKHEIEFRFEPKSYYTGEKFSLAGSILFYITFFGLLGYYFYIESKKIIL